jgi:hypothetical protein
MFNYNNMLYWFIKCITFLLLIGLLHYLYVFLIDTLTVPKLRDFVNKPAERYSNINVSMYKDSEQSADEMQTELRDFLSNIKTDTN